MATYNVVIPIDTLDAELEVEAESEGEAVARALEELTSDDFEWRPGTPTAELLDGEAED